MREIMLLILLALIFCATNKVSETACREKALAQNMEWQFGIMKGCIVKHNGKWIDYERLRYAEINNVEEN